MTSMVFLIDIVFSYDINGFSHRYLLSHQWFCPYISYFYMTSTCFPNRYRICIWHQCIFRHHDISLALAHRFPSIDIVFLYDINGFSHIYLLRHQWFCPYISYFYMTSTCFPHRYRIFVWHPLVFPIDVVFLHDIYLFST